MILDNYAYTFLQPNGTPAGDNSFKHNLIRILKVIHCYSYSRCVYWMGYR